MSVTITDIGNQIEFVDTGEPAATHLMQKRNIRLLKNSAKVNVYDNNDTQYEIRFLAIDPADVAGVADLDALYTLIRDMMTLGFDDVGGAQIGTNQEHHEIHEGDHYFYSDCITLADSATQDYMLTVSDTLIRKHITFTIKGSAGITIALFEGTDKTGTALQTSYNNDRDSANQAELAIHKGTSGGSTDGTDIHPDCDGSSAGKGTAGVLQRSNEIILMTNTKYIVRITSGANSNNISTNFEWYEHTDSL